MTLSRVISEIFKGE